MQVLITGFINKIFFFKLILKNLSASLQLSSVIYGSHFSSYVTIALRN